MNRTTSVLKSVLRKLKTRVSTLVWKSVFIHFCSQIKRMRHIKELNCLLIWYDMIWVYLITVATVWNTGETGDIYALINHSSKIKKYSPSYGHCISTHPPRCVGNNSLLMANSVCGKHPVKTRTFKGHSLHPRTPVLLLWRGCRGTGVEGLNLRENCVTKFMCNSQGST